MCGQTAPPLVLSKGGNYRDVFENAFFFLVDCLNSDHGFLRVISMNLVFAFFVVCVSPIPLSLIVIVCFFCYVSHRNRNVLQD